MIRLKILAILLVGFNCLGTTYLSQDIIIVDKISKIGLREGSPEMAFEALKCIAEGSPETMDKASMVIFGVNQADLAVLKTLAAQTHSLYKMAEIGSARAVSFFAALKPGDLGPDPSNRLDIAIALCYWQALAVQEKDYGRRVSILRKAMAERSASVASWAENALCDSGEITALTGIQRAVRSRNPGERGEAEIRFCEARMRVLTSGGDRVTALAGALRIAADEDNVRLISWSVMQLLAVHSSEADRALAEFSDAIAALPDNSKERMMLAPVRGTIEDYKASQ